MRTYSLILLTVLSYALRCYSQSDSSIVVPPFDDRYCQAVRELEAGRTDIDYAEFRSSFLESRQFLIAGDSITRFDSLKKAMYAHIKSSDYAGVLSLTKRMLSIDYTSMLAHKILRQTYHILGDTLNSEKHRTIELGLLKSIVSGRDGTTPHTAWPVIQISEEYFILQMLGATLRQQSIVSGDGLFDKMEVTQDGKDKVYYFEVSKVFEGYKRGGIK